MAGRAFTWLLAGFLWLGMISNAEAGRRSCKQYKNCGEAVRAWCAGLHPGADRDDDGLPCENVCKRKKQVDREKAKIGCKK